MTGPVGDHRVNALPDAGNRWSSIFLKDDGDFFYKMHLQRDDVQHFNAIFSIMYLSYMRK